MDAALFTLSAIAFLTIVSQWLAWWVKLPAILFLLLCGIILGPATGFLQPNQFFGHLLMPMVSLSVAVILFEGSLTLNFDQIREQVRVVRNLVTIGLLVTAILTAYFVHEFIGLSWALSALLGAITAVTGPTVIMPMLRTIRPNATVANILRWEGTLIDPIGAILAVIVFSLISFAHGAASAGDLIKHVIEVVIIGFLMGVVFGYWLGIALRRHWVPQFLHNVATLTIVIIAFTLSNIVDAGSGLLAVTIMGIWLANMDNVPVEDILGFKESLSILLISGLFIILGARLSFEHLAQYVVGILMLFAALQFIVRPASVLLCTIGSTLNWREKTLIAWVSPRGIVAAAVAALFSLRLKALGVAHAQTLVLITFVIIICTVVFQSLTATWLARLLKVSEPEPKGFLIVGVNRVARAIAKALEQHDFRVLLAGLNWEHIQKSRMEGLEVYYGNPISEHADRHLNLVGIGHMLAISPQSDLNSAAVMRYKSEFGNKEVFSIQMGVKTKGIGPQKFYYAAKHRGDILFGDEVTYEQLKQLLRDGAEIHTTQLTENFDMKSYLVRHQSKAIPLFAVTPKGRLKLFTATKTPSLAAGSLIVGLIPKN